MGTSPGDKDANKQTQQTPTRHFVTFPIADNSAGSTIYEKRVGRASPGKGYHNPQWHTVETQAKVAVSQAYKRSRIASLSSREPMYEPKMGICFLLPESLTLRFLV